MKKGETGWGNPNHYRTKYKYKKIKTLLLLIVFSLGKGE